ncbi:hypothetical protein DFH06DRAFT_1311579 [Mycena polygramma]|nr:hypothetical protein DFH06DRAFT_1311579 [Mycena polygramma]
MPKVDESNARTIWIVDALKSAVQDPTYQVLLPWLHPSTWDSVVSPVDCIRNGLRVVGRKCLGYCLLLAFFDVADGLEAGSLPGHYETVEECLLREDVLVEILRKVKSPGIQPIASRGTAVRGPFLVFLGGLWQDTCSLDKMTPWIFMVFVPLIRVALKAYNELCDPDQLHPRFVFDHSSHPVALEKHKGKPSERGRPCPTPARFRCCSA